MLSKDVYRECVKALAYGKNTDEICCVMNVPKAEVEAISQTDVNTEREYLKKVGT